MIQAFIQRYEKLIQKNIITGSWCLGWWFWFPSFGMFYSSSRTQSKKSGFDGRVLVLSHLWTDSHFMPTMVNQSKNGLLKISVLWFWIVLVLI